MLAQVLIYYQEEGCGIVQAILRCNNTGHLNMKAGDSWIITGGAPVVVPLFTIQPATDLAVFPLSAGGHRLFYHGVNNQPMMIEYQPNPSGSESVGAWYDAENVSQDNRTGAALAATYYPNSELLFVTVLNDNKTIEIASKRLDESLWRIGKQPDLSHGLLGRLPAQHH